MKNLRAAYGERKTGEKKKDAVQLNMNINASVEKRRLVVFVGEENKTTHRNPLAQNGLRKGILHHIRLLESLKKRKIKCA